jgi:hypothetical protein
MAAGALLAAAAGAAQTCSKVTRRIETLEL